MLHRCLKLHPPLCEVWKHFEHLWKLSHHLSSSASFSPELYVSNNVTLIPSERKFHNTNSCQYRLLYSSQNSPITVNFICEVDIYPRAPLFLRGCQVISMLFIILCRHHPTWRHVQFTDYRLLVAEIAVKRKQRIPEAAARNK